MEGMGTEAFAMAPYASQLPNQLPWPRSSGPVGGTANGGALICRLAPSHHGEAGAARPSSAEAHLFSDRQRSTIQTNPSVPAGAVRC